MKVLPELAVTVHDEELVNAATHGVGLGCSLVAGVVLICTAARHGSAWHIWGCSIYAATLIAAYAASTLSHAFRRPGLRHAFRIADQAIIFLFIAGSFTPVALAYLNHGAWWILIGLVWGIALAGFLQKAVFAHRVQLGAVSASLYVLLGWLPVMATRPMISVVPLPLLLWILAGGICYSAGIIFFHYDNRVRYFHAAWHMMVIAGTTCHYIGNLIYCTGGK
jgi:hemolysin III